MKLFIKLTVAFHIILFIGAIFLPQYTHLQDLFQKDKELTEEIEELKKDNLILTEEQKKLESDPVYIERIARKKLGVAREGEIIYKIHRGVEQSGSSQGS